MAKKYLDNTGLALVWAKIKELVATKVDKVDGKGLSTNDYTTDEKTKLSGIATGAQVNVLEGIQKNGSTVTVTNKIANITVPTKTSDITNDSGFITTSSVPTATTTTPKMDGTAAVGSETKWAKGDHVHPSDTSRVPTTRTVNGHALSADVTVTKADVGLDNVDNTADANKIVASAGKLTTAVKLEGVSFDGSANTSYYATCSTAAATAAKTATIADQTFVLQTGARVFVKFTYANSAANSTLDVNSTGAKAIYYNGSAIAKSVTDANGTYEFVYNGTQWELVGDLDTNNTYTAATATPLMDGEGAVGTSTKYAREDHVHPSDTTKVDKVDGKGLSTNDYTTEEKTKLSNIASGAEVNQNAFSNVKVGSTTIAADSKTDTLTLTAGDNITLTPDASNDKVTIAATDTITTATTTGAGNAVTAITASNGQLSVVKGSEFILTSAIGTASGVCPLDANALIDSQYLPSFVDDIIEAYARTGATALSASWLSDTSASGSALTPQSGVIYVLMNDTTDYAANSQFRWSGTAYVKLNDGGVSPITNEEINTICV